MNCLVFEQKYLRLELTFYFILLVGVQSGLFVYDVFWVFGTDVMVTVAKGFEAPIKLLFPKALIEAGVKTEFSMVGLGDIVIPG